MNNYDGGNDLFIFGFLSAPITKSDYTASTDKRCSEQQNGQCVDVSVVV
jgi:hypothetical protein